MTPGTDMNIPAELKGLNSWLVWRFEQRPDEPKPRKVPHYAGSGHKRNGTQGSPDDLRQLTDFATAVRVAQKDRYAGVGFAPQIKQRLVFLDFDHCVVDGHVDPEVVRYVSDTYCEFSPSGKGVRAVMSVPDGVTIPDGKDNPKDGRWGFETFAGKGFVTITGNVLPICRMLGNESRIAPLTPEIMALIEERIGAPKAASTEGAGETDAGSAQPLEKLDRDRYLREFTPRQFEELRSALLEGVPAEDAEDRKEWVKHGHSLAALKGSEFEEQARHLWHEFSQRCPSLYSQEDAETRWRSFRTLDTKGKTPRSIFERALDAGWAAPGTRAAAAAAAYNGDTATYATLEDRTDVGNANLLIRLTDGNLRYIPERRMWIFWDGNRWTEDEYGTLSNEAARSVGRFYHAKVFELECKAKDPTLSKHEKDNLSKAAQSLDRWVKTCRDVRTINAMLAQAAKDARVALPATELNTDPWLLGTQNGAVDLRTGRLCEVSRDQYVTKRAAFDFDPDAKCPRFEQFITEITGSPVEPELDEATGLPIPASVGRYKPRPDVADYIQRMVGYGATGTAVEHKMFIACGPGANGKNILLDTLQEVLGDYVRTIAPEALMATRLDADAERASPALASLAGARMAITSESRDGQKLDAALIKRHTGGGFLTARLLRENSFRFEITHKLVLMTNHRPHLDHLDDAMRGRLHLVPFDRTWNRPGVPDRDPSLPDGDKGLMDALRAEGPGILAWVVRGAVAYHKHGLEPPAAVRAMTRQYFAEQDPVARWVEGYGRCHPKEGAGATELFSEYQQWRRDVDTAGGSGPQNATTFATALQMHRVTRCRTKHGMRYGLKRKQGGN